MNHVRDVKIETKNVGKKVCGFHFVFFVDRFVTLFSVFLVTQTQKCVHAYGFSLKVTSLTQRLIRDDKICIL